MHAKPEKIYDTVLDPRAAKFKVCVDGLRFYLGVALIAGTICNPLTFYLCSDIDDGGVLVFEGVCIGRGLSMDVVLHIRGRG